MVWYDRYWVTTPCANVTVPATNCTTFAGDDTAGSPAYADSVQGTNNICYALGHISQRSVEFLVAGDPSKGAIVTFAGGVGGRMVRFNLICDPTVSGSSGPSSAKEHVGSYVYDIMWPTSQACRTASASCPELPRPTPDQLLFQEMEMGALVCYNMATTIGSQGCRPHQVLFDSAKHHSCPEENLCATCMVIFTTNLSTSFLLMEGPTRVEL